jgi:septum formation protein
MSALAVAPVILASASETRAELLRAAGLAVIADPAALDETAIKSACRAAGENAAGCALALAEAKAARVAERHQDALVIGADQLLVAGDLWFDKPGDRAAARAQLLHLNGRRHELVTAVVAIKCKATLWRHVERPALTMRACSDGFLEAYLAAAGDSILAAVGAYRLEGLGAQLFERVEGDLFSILGLPLLPLLDFLRGQGVVGA